MIASFAAELLSDADARCFNGASTGLFDSIIFDSSLKDSEN